MLSPALKELGESGTKLVSMTGGFTMDARSGPGVTESLADGATEGGADGVTEERADGVAGREGVEAGRVP